ncbi:hypothetical protein ACFOHU_13305 [Ottowia pentelensis]|uniref:DUF4124 domain-containing protein n=1 Tax=Ottowia pentelensis TaxID=511108 RepID=A0ABV6PUD0_9BURK
MSSDSPIATEAPRRPPEPARETGWPRWIAVLVALGLLLFGLKAYQWLQGYVAQRHALARQETPALAEPQASLVPTAPTATPNAEAEPIAPAVTGEAVHRCLRPDGQMVLTNQACPSGSRPEAAPPAADQRPPAAAAIRWAGDDPSLHDATCHYLTAEIERLGYEFQQPLPPPVIDGISTRLSTLRGESAQGGCAPLPKPAAAPGERSSHKVLTERNNAAPKARR